MVRFIVPTLLVLLASGGASGQLQTSLNDEVRARLIGVLEQTRLTIEFDAVPARVAFRSISAALRTTINVHYAEDGSGVDPEVPVTFRVVGSPARLVLESVLEQCALYEPCSWQLRTGYIEVGTKERLGYSAAETRRYNVRDLMLEMTYFTPSGEGEMLSGIKTGRNAPAAGAGNDFDRHPYACAALTRPNSAGRKSPATLIDELAEGIVELVEPGNWEFGQDDGEGDTRLARSGNIAGPWQAAPRRPGGRIARIRVQRDTLVVAAPDYIHRQIGGYPRPIPPARLSEDERRERSLEASAGGARVVVEGPGGAARDRGP